MKLSTNPGICVALFGIVGLALFAAGQAHAGKLDTSVVPSTAQIVGHIDLDELRGSQIAKTFRTEIAAAKKKIADKLSELKTALTVDDLYNAASITFWAAGDDPENGAMVLSGIDAKKFTAAVRKLPEHRSLGGALHRVGDKYVGFTRSRMVVADDRKSIKATLKVISGSGTSLAQTRRGKNLKATTGVFFMAAFEEMIAKKIKQEANSPIFKNVNLARGTISVAEVSGELIAKADLETTDTAGADQLHKLAAGGISFLSVASDNAELGKLLDALKIKSSGKTVSFRFELPVNQLKNIAKALDK